MEVVQQFRPNVVGFQMTTGERRWYIMGCYLTPYQTLMTESVVAALKERPRGAKLLVAEDFNVKLSDPEGDQRGKDIAAAMETEGLEDMLVHLLPHWLLWCRDGRTWSMIREWREVRSWTDYILGTDLRIFENVSVRDPSHNSDHHSAPLREHTRYLGGAQADPPPPTDRPDKGGRNLCGPK